MSRQEELQGVNIGENIKRIRLKNKLTQHQFGEIIGKSATTVHCYENNTTLPPWPVLLRISSIFNISTGDLMNLKSSLPSGGDVMKLFEMYERELEKRRGRKKE